MNHAVGGILPAVSVFRESCYRHIVEKPLNFDPFGHAELSLLAKI